jgi:hypothetical protein
MAKRRVQIVELPKAKTGQQVGYGLYNRLATMGGLSDSRPRNDLSVSKTIGGVPREEANLEAEGGETVMIPEIYGNIPTHFTITGPRHAQGGVPMNLPENSFIFSDFVDMKIKDPDVLNYFNKTAKKGGKGKGYTPADIAKQYDINKYIKILQDPSSDDIDKKTAELMIKNYNLKLGALGLVQEAQKGFEDGVPEVSEPFMDKMGISPADLGVVSPEAKELSGAIQQMVEQGIGVEEVIGQLLTQEIPPEIIMEALTVLGMDQKEAAALLEAVMMQVTESVEQPMQSQQESPYPEMPIDTQGADIQNQQMMEEPGMSPEMMLYGGKVRRLKRKQMGGPADMMPPEQMMGQPEMEQEDPMQEIMQQVAMGVEEMMQAGENVNTIVMQLLQMQVPEEVIAEVLVQFGVPEQEIQQAFEVAMSHPEMGQDPMMDPNMQGQGMSPDMMPGMDPSMMQIGGSYYSPELMEDGGIFDPFNRYGDKPFNLSMDKSNEEGNWIPGMSRGRKDARQIRRNVNRRIREGYVDPQGIDYSQFARTRTKDFMVKAPKVPTFFDGGEAQTNMQQDSSLEEMIIEALEQGADPQQVIEILVQQGLDPERAQEAVMMVTQQMGQPMMRRGGSLPKYEKAGEVPKKYRDDPRYNKTAEGFTYAGLKKGDYINLGNDEFIQLKVDIPEDFEFSGVTDEFASSKRSNVETALFQLAYFKELSKNPKLKEAFHNAYMDSIKEEKLFKSAEKGTTSSYFGNKNLEKVSPDELIDLYTKHVEANVSLYLKGLDPEDFTQNGKLDPKVNKDKYKDFVEDKADINLKNIYAKAGMKPEGLDIAKSQAAQWAYQKITSSPETYFKDNPEMQQLVKDVLTTDPSFGVADEKGTGYQEKRISPIDGYLGNTTIGHAGQVMLTGPKVKDPLVKDAEDVEDLEESKDPSSPSYRPPSYVDLDWSPTHYAQYQDAINRRYLPNLTLGMPDINMQIPGVHLQDWRQEAYDRQQDAAQMSQAMLSMPGTGAQTRANILGIQGKTAQGIGRDQARVKGINQQVLNQAEGVAADVANRTNIARGTAWDRILQQMNERTQEEWVARRKSDTDAINVAAVATDDQAKRAGLMMTNPRVAIDPRGFMYMHNPLDFYPEKDFDSDLSAKYNKYYDITKDKETAIRMLELDQGKGHYRSDKSSKDPKRTAAQDAYNMMYGQKGGSIGVLGSHVFPFMFY